MCHIIKVRKYILILIALLQGCGNKCHEVTFEDATKFVNLHGAEAVQIFNDIDIEIREGYVIDFRIDRKNFRLEDNPKIKRDSVFIRFNNNIRFFYKDGMTFSEFCSGNEFEDSYYSLNYVHHDSLSDPKKFAYKITSELVEKLKEFGIQEVDSRLYCKDVKRFYLYPRCKDYHVVMYVPDTTHLFPSFWKSFIKTDYAKKIKEGWYYYTYKDFNTYSKYFYENGLQTSEVNPCFGQ